MPHAVAALVAGVAALLPGRGGGGGQLLAGPGGVARPRRAAGEHAHRPTRDAGGLGTVAPSVRSAVVHDVHLT